MNQARMIGTGIRVSLRLIVVIIAFRRYGLHAMATRRKIRHAAIGRAKRSWSYIGSHTSTIVGSNVVASELVAQLRRERQELAWCTYRLNVRTA